MDDSERAIREHSLRMRARRGEEQQIFNEYRHDRTRKASLVALAKLEPPNSEVERLILRIAACHWMARCHEVFCPNCGGYQQRREVNHALKKIYARALGHLPAEDLSLITINFEQVEPSGASLRRGIKRQRDTLGNFLRRHLPTAGIHGYFELAPATPFSGEVALHFHGVIHHVGIVRTEVEHFLRTQYPGRRRVRVVGLGEQSVLVRLERWLRYSSKALPKPASLAKYEGEISSVLGQSIDLRRRMTRGTPYLGVRLSLNMSTKRSFWRDNKLYTDANELIPTPPLTSLLRASKREREILLRAWDQLPPNAPY